MKFPYLGQRVFQRLCLPSFGMKIMKSYTKNVPSLECLNRLRECYRVEEQNNIVVPVFKRALLYGNFIAIRDQAGEYGYFQMYANSKRLSEQLANLVGSGSGAPVAFFYTNDALCTLILWACWMSGQVAMPLNAKRSNYTDLLTFLKHGKVRLLISSEKHCLLGSKLCMDLEIPSITLDHKFVQHEIQDFNQSCRIFTTNNQAILSGTLTNDFYTKFNALMLNTNDKGNKIKTAVISHRNLSIQLKSGATLWQLTEDDRVHLAFPSDHINGYVNAMQFVLSAGSGVQMQEPFDGHTCWSTILGLNTPQKDRANVFMSEPQGYKILLDIYDKIFAKNSSMVEFIKNYCQRNYRLMTSTFAPLPMHLAKRWLEITGHQIWQSYYVTEGGITMATYDTNGVFTTDQNANTPLPESSNFLPLPYINVRLVDQANNVLLELQGTQKESKNKTGDSPTKIGMLMISGPAVFGKYMNWDQSVEDADECYFATGDIVSYENGAFQLLGRCYVANQSINVIKKDGEELHTCLHLHPSIDFTRLDSNGFVYGLKTNHRMSLKSLQLFCAIIMKDLYYKALIFHLNTVNK